MVEQQWPHEGTGEGKSPGGFLVWLKALVTSGLLIPALSTEIPLVTGLAAGFIAFVLSRPLWQAWFDRRFFSGVAERRGLVRESSSLLIDDLTWVTLWPDSSRVEVTLWDGLYLRLPLNEITGMYVDLETEPTFLNRLGFGQPRSFDLVLVNRAEDRHRLRLSSPELAEAWRRRISHAREIQQLGSLASDLTSMDVYATVGDRTPAWARLKGWVTLPRGFQAQPGEEFLVVQGVSADFAEGLRARLERSRVTVRVAPSAASAEPAVGFLNAPMPPPLLAAGPNGWPAFRKYWPMGALLGLTGLVFSRVAMEVFSDRTDTLLWYHFAGMAVVLQNLGSFQRSIMPALRRLKVRPDDVLNWERYARISYDQSFFVPSSVAPVVFLGDGKGRAMELRLEEWRDLCWEPPTKKNPAGTMVVMTRAGEEFRMFGLFRGSQERLWCELHELAREHGVALPGADFEIVSLWLTKPAGSTYFANLHSFGTNESGNPGLDRPLVGFLSRLMPEDALKALEASGLSVEIRPARLDDHRPYLKGFGWVALQRRMISAEPNRGQLPAVVEPVVDAQA